MVDGQAGKGDRFRSVDAGVYGSNYDAIFRSMQDDDDLHDLTPQELTDIMKNEEPLPLSREQQYEALVNEAADDWVAENSTPFASMSRQRLEGLVTMFILGYKHGDMGVCEVADNLYDEFLSDFEE